MVMKMIDIILLLVKLCCIIFVAAPVGVFILISKPINRTPIHIYKSTKFKKVKIIKLYGDENE